jgi:energy-coupling factor transporter ATP-binding protein EcfA2
MDDRIKGHLDKQAPRLPWDEFYDYVFDWKQSQHVAMIGPTDSGKTTLALAILPIRKYITVLATKPKDETLRQFGRSNGFHRYTEWPELDADLGPRRLVWPDATSLYSAVNQRKHFQRSMAQIYREGGWCLYIDELWFIIHHLRLELEVRTYLQQARSNNISLVVATQRPAFVPLEVYDQSQHLFFWRDNDERNLNRISGISWLNANYVRALVANLERHEVLYINTPTGEMYRTTAPVGGK